MGILAKKVHMDDGRLPPVKTIGTHIMMLYTEVLPDGILPSSDKVDLESGWIKSMLSKLKRHGGRKTRGSATCIWLFLLFSPF